MITINTTVVHHTEEDYVIKVPDPDLTDAELWLMSGCSREAAKQWHERVMRSIHAKEA